MTINAKDFKTRNDLEAYIQAEFGGSININRQAGHILSGKREELKKLHLSDLTTVFGVKCVITDLPTKDKIKKK